MPEEEEDGSPTRRGRHVLVRPIRPQDYGWVFETALFTPAGARWRLHGEAPTFETFVDSLFRGSTVTSIIERVEAPERVGMCQLWNRDPLSRTAQLTAFLAPEYERKGWPLEGVILFLAHAFAAWDLRKIYFESLAPQAALYRSQVGKVLVEEGVLKNHRYVMGEFVDCHIFALYRESFLERTGSIVPDARIGTRSTSGDFEPVEVVL